jgi:hypothetical protein
MAAGLGFKTFAVGEVLSAANVNGYLMQGVLVFADAAARTAAITSPQEGQMSFLKDTNSTEYYSGSAWVAVGGGGTIPASYGYAAGKNKIINGDFFINQRGFTTTTASAFGFDRFYNQSDGASGTATFTAQTFTAGTAPVSGYEAKNFLRCVTAGQSAAGVFTIFQQQIEDVRVIAGQTVTISFWAKSASATPKIAIEVEQNFGAGGSPSAAVQTYAGQVTLSTSWDRYSVSVAVPSISGKTIGTTANTSSNGINLWVSAGTTYNSRTGSLGIQSNTFDIWGLQVEQGSTATAFQTATGTLQGELAACQRYYFRNTQTGNNQHLTPFGSAVSSTAAAIDVFFPVPMRTNPTAIESANLAVTDGANARTNVTSVTFNASSNLVANCEYNVASGLTQYRPYSLFNQTSTTAYVGFSAEL